MAASGMELRTKFLNLLRNYPDALTDAEVKAYFDKEGMNEYERLPPLINALMTEGKIKIFQKGNVLSYGVVGAEEAEKMRGLTVEQRLVLQEIERAGNKGIWTRDIKTHTNIPQQIITKTLRLLETRRLVKSVKSISSKNKKLYMLYDLVPSTEITGGPWYNEQEFDHMFIETLSTFVYEVIKAAGMITLKEITDKVHASGISKVALGLEEIKSIVQNLMYDQRVEEVRPVQLTAASASIGLQEIKYKVSREISTFNYLSETPCGVCPVFEQCQEGNIISPRSCVYYSKWFDLQEADF